MDDSRRTKRATGPRTSVRKHRPVPFRVAAVDDRPGVSYWMPIQHEATMSSDQLKDMTGRRFGSLIVESRAPEKRPTRWICRCDCGGVKIAEGGALRRGKNTTCGGCGPARGGSPRAHGKIGTRTYTIWKRMKERCSNPNHDSYRKYGGRGIAVCQRWAKSFVDFLSDMGEAPRNCSIDRIDTLGNYEPGNCRWATSKEQSRNARHNVWVEVHGERMIATDAAAVLGISISTISKRISQGKIKRATK